MQSQLCAALASQGQLDAAEPLLQAGCAHLQQALGEEDARTLAAKSRLAHLHAARRTPPAPTSGHSSPGRGEPRTDIARHTTPDPPPPTHPPARYTHRWGERVKVRL